MQQATDVIPMIMHAEFSSNHFFHPGLGPLFGRNSGRLGASFQDLDQLLFLSSTQLRWTSAGRVRLPSFWSALVQLLGCTVLFHT